jgi:serine protease Do
VPGRVIESLRRSTVRVTSGQGNGSGVVLTGERIVTNAHVIRGARLSVESWEGKTLPASLIKIDRRRDLALLAVVKLDAPAATLGDSGRLQAGAPVVAIGNPLGFTGAVSSGVVHAGGGLNWVYADVRLAPGNSGGPLADLRGEVVGINTMIVAGGLALAIPSRAVQSFLNRAAAPATLGVVVRPVRLRNGDTGMLILELVSNGAAETASLLPGDILVGSGDSRFRNVDDLQAAIDRAPAGLLHIDFYRAGQQTLRRVSVRLCPEPALSAA